MKKVLFAAAAIAVMGISASAAELVNADFQNGITGWGGDVENVTVESGAAVIGDGAETDFYQEIEAEAGYYDVTATITSDSTDGICYLYGKGEGYTMASTAVPEGDKVQVVVRGIGAEDGRLKIGLYSDGSHGLTMDDVTLTKTDNPYVFYKGADITELNYVEDHGGVYKYQDGTEGDAVEILKDYGVNMARIRLYNSPGKGRGYDGYYLPEGYQDEADCLDLARRAKDAGMAIQFTFHYSDYWSNGERQLIPADWQKEIEGMEREEAQQKLAELVYSYTKDIMTKLSEQGTTPEFVSLGNEINGGLLFPYGNTYVIDDFNGEYCPVNWDGLAKFINAGYEAVKEVSPETEVVIHLADAPIESKIEWFMKEFVAAGAKFDVLGFSYYPAWSQMTIEECTAFCNTMAKRYDRDILIMETGYNWNETKADGYPGQLGSDLRGEMYPFTKEGHKAFLTELYNGLKQVEGGRCIGDIYWDPVMIHCDGVGWAYKEADDTVDSNVVENTTLFDFDGVGIPSLDVMATNMNSEKESSSALELVSEENGVYTVKNNADSEQSVTLYKAAYESGILNDVKFYTSVIAPGETAELSVELDGYNVRTYLWGDNMVPVE